MENKIVPLIKRLADHTSQDDAEMRVVGVAMDVLSDLEFLYISLGNRCKALREETLRMDRLIVNRGVAATLDETLMHPPVNSIGELGEAAVRIDAICGQISQVQKRWDDVRKLLDAYGFGQ